MAATMDAMPLSALSPDDIVIAVMGITGSGKSSFINLLADDDVRIGHELESCTTDVQIFAYLNDAGRRVYLIDTPGFDDTSRTDTEVLKDVAFFLSQTYKQTVQLTGIIYLHRITDNRMSGSSIRNLSMFKKLCGNDAFPHVILATTMWGNLSRPEMSFERGVENEAQLIERPEWWGMMHERGSQVVRHAGDKESAQNIVNALIASRSQDMVLEIQKEMVIDNMSLDKTAAGREVEKEIHEAREKWQAEIVDVQQNYEEALRDRDEQMAKALLQQRNDLESKLQQASNAQELLKVSLERLAEEKTAQYNQLLQQFVEEQKKNEEMLSRYQKEQEQLQAEREADAQRHRQEQLQLERKFQEAEQRTQQMLAKRNEEEASRLKEEQERYEQQLKKLQAQHEEQEEKYQQKAEDLKVKIKEKKKRRKRDFVMPVLTLLAGVGTTVAGVFTLQPGMLVSGFGMMFKGGSNAFSAGMASPGDTNDVQDVNEMDVSGC